MKRSSKATGSFVSSARAMARLTITVVFPTPPLPLLRATTLPSIFFFSGAGATASRHCRPRGDSSTSRIICWICSTVDDLGSTSSTPASAASFKNASSFLSVNKTTAVESFCSLKSRAKANPSKFGSSPLTKTKCGAKVTALSARASCPSEG
jgi:hypothetical protein